ncbi:peptidoglycan/xylan/chitin deacetylase (PgdA/CDA1 family) [Nocardioides cavernae]|uniref:Peptidoglycan/xylan/chitin deacetylase (PgdA/CDA1 family) n=1 Tax=Nocardioides cavernae TaxID=1921566 RepID=A0A7Y9KRN3_9ACTN|nr:glycosyltransferase [Nocardioides cavernae]NYE35517.1 peptidoglycan/xylan/chitin deacetylase (PgdA/CDA1 family) [Nocardioides cavernae]
MSGIDHVLLTRFNLPTGGLEGLVRAREGWLRERIDLFERYCAPSVAGQQDADVTWIVYLDPASPQWLLDRIAPYAEQGLLHPVLREVVGVPELREDIAALVPRSSDILLTTNLDNDDGLAVDFCARIAAAAKGAAPGRAALYATRGLVLADDGLFVLRDRHNAFCSVRESWHDPVTSWSEYHNELPRVMPTIELDGPPSWLQVVHTGNVSNRVRGRLVAPSAHRSRFAVPLEAREPTARELLVDRTVTSSARRLRDGGRATARRAGLRLLGKDGYAAAKAGLREARSTLHDGPTSLVNLCFHGIGEPGRELEPGEETYWIDRTTFAEILDLVRDRPDVRLSFDDANASDATIALPELLARGLTASFFVVAGRLDQPGSLTSDQVRQLHAAGMTIGNHGMTHCPWRGLGRLDQDREYVAAREAIAAVIGAPVHDAALPLGRYDRRVVDRLRTLDYRSVHTSDRRRAREGRWLQPRYSIHSGDTAAWVEQELLRPPSVAAHARGALVGTAKRWR